VGGATAAGLVPGGARRITLLDGCGCTVLPGTV